MTARVYSNSFEPTLAEFKRHIRLTTCDMDEDLTMKLKASIRSAEHYIGRIIALSSFTHTGDLDSVVRLFGPVVGISSVKVDGQTLSSDKYVLKGDRLYIDAVGDEVQVVYTAGMEYPDDDIKAAVLLHAAALFNNPVDSVEMLPKASMRLLDPYRTWGL